MKRNISSNSPASPPSVQVPTHWSPKQALAAFECLHAMREALWMLYGTQVQQA